MWGDRERSGRWRLDARVLSRITGASLQAATPSGGDILVEAVLQEPGLAFAGHTNDIQVSGAG